MSAIKSHKDLLVWQRGMDLAENCYRLVSSLPREELYGLTSQVRRACVSIPSNIAEGHNNGSTGVFLRHLAVALGSQAELETQLDLAVRLGLTTAEDAAPVLADVAEIGRLLHGLVRSLEARAAGLPPL
jgi:four helix bundle protein